MKEFEPIEIEVTTSHVKKVSLPKKMSNEIAEILGIHFGDGHMCKEHKSTYRLDYSFNSRDEDYAKYVNKLFFGIFNVNMKIHREKNKKAIGLYIHSKVICYFLNQRLGIGYGSKKDLRIPEYIRKNRTYLLMFIRGLFDTDGCFTIQKDKKYEYKLIKFKTKEKNLALDIKDALASLGIRSYICDCKPGYDTVIRNKESYEEFLRIVQPKNKRGKNGDGGNFD